MRIQRHDWLLIIALAMISVILLTAVYNIYIRDYPQRYAPGEIVVDFKDNVTYEEIAPIIESYNLTVINIYNWTGQDYYTAIVQVPVGEEEAMAETLGQHPAVVSASPNYLDVY